jgi:hypothetical protein
MFGCCCAAPQQATADSQQADIPSTACIIPAQVLTCEHSLSTPCVTWVRSCLVHRCFHDVHSDLPWIVLHDSQLLCSSMVFHVEVLVPSPTAVLQLRPALQLTSVHSFQLHTCSTVVQAFLCASL